jgi:hypothetical protein
LGYGGTEEVSNLALSNSYVQVYGQLGDFFRRIAEAQAPEKFTTQYLKDLGLGSSNFRAVIPLLKSLGFLTPEGAPANRYLEYRNTARSRRVMAEALREAYGDLFTIRASPTDADRELIEGKFRSAHNATPITAKLMASTFYSLLELADLSDPSSEAGKKKDETKEALVKPLAQSTVVPEKHPEPTPVPPSITTFRFICRPRRTWKYSTRSSKL